MNEARLKLAQLNKKHKRRQIWLRILSVLMCITVFITTYALILPAVTMDTSDPTVTKINFGGIEWDDSDTLSECRLQNISLHLSVTKDGIYTLQKSSDNGANWAAVTGYTTGKMAASSTDYTLFPNTTALDTLFNEAALNDRFRIVGRIKNADTPTVSYGYVDLLDIAKPGFKEWVVTDYVNLFDGTAPVSKDDYKTAFRTYYHIPTATVTVPSQTGETADVTARVTVTDMNGTVLDADDYKYQWQYLDEETSTWKVISSAIDADYTVNPANSDPIPFGGAQVRCIVTNASDDKFVTRSSAALLNPQEYRFRQIRNTVETELGLASLAINNGKTLNLSYTSSQWDWVYFKEVAKDPNVPFYDKESLWNYLCKTYLLTYDQTAGDATAKAAAAKAAVKKEWNYYRYDMIDPGALNTNYGTYYTTGGFADSELQWVKTADADDSFHYQPASNPTDDQKLILPLEYGYLDNGVDYESFMRDMSKYATADAAGDGNSERKYTVHMETDAHATVKVPIVILFQVQTSWQLFDLEHANALAGTGKTEVGAVANNTELATLYEIKHAMLDLCAYMEKKYPGNNLIIGVTEVRHGGSDSMFESSIQTGNGSAPLYVSNNPKVLYDAISQWDVFGNCEHVHYDNDTLKLAVQNLGVDLSDLKDKNNRKISYSDIRKAVVIIGGPTENKGSENGYNCILPWDNFASSDIDSVYGIRVNRGTSYAGNTDKGTPILSWLDNDGNNTGTYKDGNGENGFTQKYVCTDRQSLYDTFLEIAEKEFAVGGIEVQDVNSNVDNVTLKDTIREEFKFDPKKPISISLTPDLNGNRASSVSIDLQKGVFTGTFNGSVSSTSIDGVTTYTLSYGTVPTVPHPRTVTVTENADGTATVDVNFSQMYNTQKAQVDFGIQAREDYIGSNNVYTNVGAPKTTYQHTAPNATEPKDYSIVGTDHPQVNVPIEFTTENGSHKVLYRAGSAIDYDISLNDADKIAAKVQALVDDYGQINGTLSYEWILPDKTTKVEVGSTVIVDGKVQGGFPDLSEIYSFTSDGFSYAELAVTFTPNAVDAKGEFHDVKTRTPVNAKEHSGTVTFEVLSPDSTEKLHVKKTWSGTGPYPEEIKFKLVYTDSSGMDHYYSVNGQIVEFTLRGDSATPWEADFEIQPSPDGNGSVYEYTAIETEVEGFASTVQFRLEKEYEYEATIHSSFTPQFANNGNKVIVHYRYNGEDYSEEFTGETLSATTSWDRTLAEHLPTQMDGTPYPAEITKVEYVNGNVYTVFKNDIDPYDCTIATVGYPVFTFRTPVDKEIDKGTNVTLTYKIGNGNNQTFTYKVPQKVGKNKTFSVTVDTLVPANTDLTFVSLTNAKNSTIAGSPYVGMRKQHVTFKTPIILEKDGFVEVSLTNVENSSAIFTTQYPITVKDGIPAGATIEFDFPDILPDGYYYVSELIYTKGNASTPLSEKTTVTFTTPLELAAETTVTVTLQGGITGTYTVPKNTKISAGDTVVVEFAQNPTSVVPVTDITYKPKGGAQTKPLTAETKVVVTTPITLAEGDVVAVTIHDNTENKDITASLTVGKNQGAAGTDLTLTTFKEGNSNATLNHTHSYTVTNVQYKLKNKNTYSDLRSPGAVTFTLPYKQQGDKLVEQNFKEKEVTLTVIDASSVSHTFTGFVPKKDLKSGTSVSIVLDGPVPEYDDATYSLSVKFDNNNIYEIDDFNLSYGGTLADAFLTVGGAMPQAALYIGGGLPETGVKSQGFNTIEASMLITEGITVDTTADHIVKYIDLDTGKTGSFTAKPTVVGSSAIFTNTTAVPAGNYVIDSVTRNVSGTQIPYYNDLNAYLKTDSMLKKVTVNSLGDITNTKIVILPSTGGDGSLVLVATGLVMMLSAIAVGFVLRRRRERELCR